LAEIAAMLERALKRRAVEGTPGGTAARVLARGTGWSVADVVCTSGPGDRTFEEQRRNVCIAMVAAGSFQYRSHAGRALLAPGSLMLAMPAMHLSVVTRTRRAIAAYRFRMRRSTSSG
jgi:AraC family transcriptional regulator